MDDEERFEPRLGTRKAKTARSGRTYLALVLAAGGRLGPGRRGSGARCGRIGRGGGIGRLLSPSNRGLQARRAIVKTRLVRLKGRGLGAARAHLNYIERDGVQRDGSQGRAYSALEDQADGKAFLEQCGGDRHQFRLIVSAEDGDQYEDLTPLVRRFMARMEEDLGTSLDWIAVNMPIPRIPIRTSSFAAATNSALTSSSPATISRTECASALPRS